MLPPVRSIRELPVLVVSEHNHESNEASGRASLRPVEQTQQIHRGFARNNEWVSNARAGSNPQTPDHEWREVVPRSNLIQERPLPDGPVRNPIWVLCKFLPGTFRVQQGGRRNSGLVVPMKVDCLCLIPGDAPFARHTRERLTYQSLNFCLLRTKVVWDRSHLRS